MANKGGFSWKRATGITRAKQRISRTTGIPMTKSGRQRKLGAAMGGCLFPLLMVVLLFLSSVSAVLAVPEKVQIGPVDGRVEQFTYPTVLPGGNNRARFVQSVLASAHPRTLIILDAGVWYNVDGITLEAAKADPANGRDPAIEYVSILDSGAEVSPAADMLIDKINGAYPLTAENVPALYAEYLALPESEKALIGSDEAIIDLLNKYAELGGGEPTTQPPATAPPVTEPPTTQLPTTQPPTTQPPTTQPPTTQPPTTEPTTGPPTTEPDDDDDFFYIGEKVFITQRGETLYTLVFDSIVFTSERNPYSDINPTSVVIVTYTYENIAEPDGVYIDWTNFADLDNTFDGGFNKFAGYPLVIPNSSQPRRINVGEKHTAKQALYLISDRYSSIIVVDFRDSFLDTFSLGAFILVANESSEPPTTQPPTTQPPATQPTTQPTTQPSTTPPEAVGKFVIFWGNTGDKLHIDPTCRTIKNGVLSGSYEQAIAAGHTEGWCKICSDGWTDARFWREGNPYAK